MDEATARAIGEKITNVAEVVLDLTKAMVKKSWVDAPNGTSYDIGEGLHVTVTTDSRRVTVLVDGPDEMAVGFVMAFTKAFAQFPMNRSRVDTVEDSEIDLLISGGVLSYPVYLQFSDACKKHYEMARALGEVDSDSKSGNVPLTYRTSNN